MSVWTSRYENKKAADQYFASINPMAARIIETKHKHVQRIGKEKWNKMSVKEQEVSLDNYFTSQVNCRNKGNTSSNNLPMHVKSVFPKLIVETGQVEIHSLNHLDENKFYKDEHSAPLCWETQSQMNLSLPPPLKERKESTSSIKSLEKNVKSVFKSLKISGRPHKSKSRKSSTATKNGDQKARERKISSSKKENYYEKRNVETNFTPSLYKDYSYPLAQNQDQQIIAEKSNDLQVIIEKPKDQQAIAEKRKVRQVIAEKPKVRQVIAEKPKPQTLPAVKLRGSRSNSNSTDIVVQPRYYDLPTKDHTQTSNLQKAKISSHARINPRSSLTLDDTEILLEDKSGAIHNLEVAIKKETQQNIYKDSQLKHSILNNKTYEVSNKNYDVNVQEESPLLTQQSSALFDSSSFGEDQNASSVRKSGFDFLDDW